MQRLAALHAGGLARAPRGVLSGIGFEADGDALSREVLAERATDGQQTAAALVDFLGDPADGALVARPFAAVDAFLCGRAAP